MAQSISPSGLFQPYVALATPGSVPAAVAIGDLNGDGRNDVALVAPLTLLVFLQTPSGALVRSVNQVVGYSRSVALGDLNGDGRLDVVVGNAGSIGVLLQSQSGTLLPMVEYPTPHASSYVVKTGDFNGDGLTDVVAIAWGNSDVAVYLQNATHALDPPVPYQVDHAGYADAVEVGDINGDGRDDIVVMAGQYYANLGILLQNPDGSLGPVVYYGLGGNRLPLGVAVGDVNGDSRRDVAVTYEGQFGGAGLGVFTQNSGGTLNALLDFPCTAESPCSGGVEAVVVADVDGDGREDVVATQGSGGGLRTYLQTPAGSLVTAGVDPLPYVTRYNPQALALGDLNGDGLTDVAIADENNGLVLLYRKTNCHEHLLDGSFEAGIPNPYWLEASTNFGTPLCTVARCGSGGGTAGPRSGAIWAWFGGFFGGVEVGTLDQDVVLPPGVATLRFYLWNGVASGNHTDDFRAFVDGVRVFATFENNPAYVYGYAPVSVELSGFADGGVHRLHFDSLTTGPGISNFSLDDVSLEVCQPAKLLSMSAASVPEGDSGTTNIIFTVSLSSPSSQNVSVSWATADGTAHAETDYIPASGSLVFPPGATTATIAVPVLGDRIYEGNEWLFVNLIDPVGAVVTQGQGIGVILDDDPAGLSIDDVIVTAPATNDASAAFTVTLAPPNPSGTVTVDYATADGTAIAGIDYETAAGTLTFPPGTVTQSVPVAVLANPQFEGARTFSVTLSGASGAPIAHAVATGTIMAPGFHTLTPCRLLDTRNPLDGPSLAAQTSRSVQVAGRCGIPATARAVSLNVAVTQATAPGHLRLYRAGSNVPLVSTINYAAGQTRSNNTIVPLSVMGQLAVFNGQVSGTAHAIFDVNGYFTSE